MAPSYRPLAASIQGAPEGVFNQDAISFQEADQIQAMQRARELANESNAMRVADQERASAQQLELENELRTRFGGNDFNGVPKEFDPDEAFKVAQRIAIQHGDIDTAMGIERITKERGVGKTPLSPAQRDYYSSILGRELPPEITIADITAGAGLQKADAYNRSVGIYENDPNRELNAQLKNQRLTGDQVRPLTESQATTFAEIQGLGDFVDNIKTKYMPYISENRGERFLAATVNPNSAAARMKGELDLVATQLAAAYNGKRLSDLDFKTMSNLIQVNDLDTMETVNNRLDRLKELMALRKDNLVTTFGNAGFNVSKFSGNGSGATGYDDSTDSASSFKIPKVSKSGGQDRPGMTFMGNDEATGLPIYKKIR